MSDSRAQHPAFRRLREVPAFYRIDFDPVPVRARHDGWTPERQRAFIDLLVVTGCVARCARAVGMTPQSAGKLYKHPGAASFARAWDEALASGRSYQLAVGIERTLLGERIPVMYRGRQVGERVRYDTGLTIAVLSATGAFASTGGSGDTLADLNRALEDMDKEARRNAGRPLD